MNDSYVSIDSVDLSPRVASCLRRHNVYTVYDLLLFPESELPQVHNLRERHYAEIHQWLAEHGHPALPKDGFWPTVSYCTKVKPLANPMIASACRRHPLFCDVVGGYENSAKAVAKISDAQIREIEDECVALSVHTYMVFLRQGVMDHLDVSAVAARASEYVFDRLQEFFAPNADDLHTEIIP